MNTISNSINVSSATPIITIGLLLFAIQVRVEAAATCDEHTQPGTTCDVFPTKLHPTQCAVGEGEVNQRADDLRDRAKDGRLDEYLNKPKHHVPVVIGPGGVPYVF